MKRLLYISIIGLFFFSCSEDFLELKPRGSETEANFYQTEEQLFQGIIATYDVLPWGGTSGWTMSLGLLNAASDECYAGGSDRSDQPSWVAWDEFNLSPELGPQEGLWNKYYTGIARANLMLEKLPEATEVDETFKARLAAESRFLRAHFYFDLLRTFRNVIMTTERISVAAIPDQTQTDPDIIYDLVEEDLRAALAEPTIPEITPLPEQGRVNKNVIRSLLGKVILYRNDESRFLEAAELFDQVINSGNYALESDFGDIFKFENEWGSESIWELQHSVKARGGWESFANGTEGNYTTQFVGMRDYSGPTSAQFDGENYAAGWSFNPVTLELVEFMREDPRFVHTIIDGNQLRNLGASYTEGFQNTDFFIRKYAPVEEFRALDGEPAINWGNNEKSIRLADVLLMAAECLVRGGGDEAAARGLVNQVRSRVALRPISNTGPSLLDAIYRERRAELATEGHRFYDLVRTGQAADVLEGFVPGVHEVLPIPQREIDLTQGSLIQNSGY